MCVSRLRIVGWAKALAPPVHTDKAYRAPCPPSASMQGAPALVGTAHEKPFVVVKQCHRLCPPYGACVGLALVLLLASPARADDVADFYRGKTVTIIVSAGAGGGYDTLARTVARFLNKHLPGNPIFVVRNMAGGGGLAAANALFSGAEKDGTQIGLLQSNSPFDPLLGTRGAQFDATKFNWLGTPSVETGLFVLSNAVPVETLADARAREITVGAAGANSTPAFHARLLNDVFGLKLKIKTGYPALTDAFYGLERGELEGYTSVIYSALQATKADWLPQKKIKVLLQYGPEKRAELAGVASAREAATSEDDRILIDAAFAPLALGRPLVMPPGVPDDRLAAMRKALMDTFADPGFVAESTRLSLGPTEPRDGNALQEVVARTYTAPPHVLERLRKLHAVPR
jgi:tripartite-type tricarboxylate transporter receptor subunit TctC